MKFLNSFTKQSMMRFSVLIILFVFILFSLVLCSYIIIIALKEQTIDWEGISLFYGSLSLNIFTVLGTKAYQKKFEKN